MKKIILVMLILLSGTILSGCDSYSEMNSDDLSKFIIISNQILKVDDNWNQNYKFNIDNNSLINNDELYLSKNSSINYNDFYLEKDKMKNYIQKIIDDKDSYQLSGIIRTDYVIHFNIQEGSRTFDEKVSIQNLYMKFTKEYKIIIEMQTKKEHDNKLTIYSFEFFYSPLNDELKKFDAISR